MADYNADTQSAFIQMCATDDCRLSVAAMKRIVRQCPPPDARAEDITAAWREARAVEENQLSSHSDKITFDRKKFAPLLDKLGKDANLEELFLEFLRQAVSG